MGQKPCGKCGELVDEAKAFCPECGNAFDDEKKRTDVSDFDRSDTTVQLGQTMFNQMLSDMGLNISKQANREKARVEVVSPVIVQHAARETNEPKPTPSEPTRSNSRKWIIVGIIAALLLAAAAVIVVAAALILYFVQTA